MFHWFLKYFAVTLLLLTWIYSVVLQNHSRVAPNLLCGMTFGAKLTSENDRHVSVAVFESTMAKSVVNEEYLLLLKREIDNVLSNPTDENLYRLVKKAQGLQWQDPVRMMEKIYNVDLPDSAPVPIAAHLPKPPASNIIEPESVKITVYETSFGPKENILLSRQLALAEEKF